jgi:hypothetical protein
MPAEDPAPKPSRPRPHEQENDSREGDRQPTPAEERVYQRLVRLHRIREALSRDDLPVM